MSAFTRLFIDHPATVDETYGQHFVMALGFGLRMIWGGLQCLVHAFVPGLFEKSGSTMISELHERMVINRHRRSAQPPALPMETRKAA
jgi:hypothetical protein